MRVVDTWEGVECPKCGSKRLTVEYVWHPWEELKYACGCGYRWQTPPKDKTRPGSTTGTSHS